MERGTEAQRRTAKRITDRAASRGVDWLLWRPAVDKRAPPRVRDLRCSFRELIEAHMVLDALDEIAVVYSPDVDG